MWVRVSRVSVQWRLSTTSVCHPLYGSVIFINNPGSWQHAGASKNWFLPSIFDTSLSSLMMWNSVDSLRVLDERIWQFRRSKHTLIPTYFQGIKNPDPAGSMPQQLNNTLQVDSGIGHSGMPYPFVCLYVQNRWSYEVIEFSANLKQRGVVFVNSGQEVKDQGRKRELRSVSAGQMLRQSCPSATVCKSQSICGCAVPSPARPRHNQKPSWRRHWSKRRGSRRNVRGRWNAALIVVDSVEHCCRQVDQTLHQWRIHCVGYNYRSTSIRRPFDCLWKVIRVIVT